MDTLFSALSRLRISFGKEHKRSRDSWRDCNDVMAASQMGNQRHNSPCELPGCPQQPSSMFNAQVFKVGRVRPTSINWKLATMNRNRNRIWSSLSLNSHFCKSCQYSSHPSGNNVLSDLTKFISSEQEWD